MTFDEIRQQLAAYRDKGLVREVWQSGGTFIVSMERGPNRPYAWATSPRDARAPSRSSKAR